MPAKKRRSDLILATTPLRQDLGLGRDALAARLEATQRDVQALRRDLVYELSRFAAFRSPA